MIDGRLKLAKLNAIIFWDGQMERVTETGCLYLAVLISNNYISSSYVMSEAVESSRPVLPISLGVVSTSSPGSTRPTTKGRILTQQRHIVRMSRKRQRLSEYQLSSDTLCACLRNVNDFQNTDSAVTHCAHFSETSTIVIILTQQRHIVRMSAKRQRLSEC
ncbi:hypothetical protein RRG08_032544 [Elysia crispata]|uniref:Uncharacterized protein n=1 Tax=Elysia crispata TaxID=231223 RepID=A0AAE0ZYQ9_9GAST|nr:hypothetical protein RRG08_032544 [Elysia crispata]